MVDYMRPSSDVSTGNWTNEAGGTTLYSSLDETSQSDSDFVRSGLNPSNDTFEVALTDPSGALSDGTLKFAVGKEYNNSTVVDVTVALIQGTTQIASWSYTNVAYGLTLKTETLTAPQIAAISNWNDLRLRVTGTAGGGAALDIDFTASSTLDSRITFSRTSLATQYDSAGKLTHAPNNIALNSNSPGSWTLDTGVTVTGTQSSGLSSPHPSTLNVIDEGTATGRKLAFQGLTTATKAIVSIYAKAGSSPYINLLAYSMCSITVDTSSWTITETSGTGTGTVENLGGGVYRISLAVANTLGGYVGVAPTNAATGNGNTGPSYTGTNKTIIFGGLQVENVTHETTARTYNATTASAYYGPRFDYNPSTLAARGILLEEQRTNKQLRSELPDSTSLTVNPNLTFTPNNAVAPNGTTTAARFVSTSGSTNDHDSTLHPTVSDVDAGSVITVSLFMKQVQAGVDGYLQINAMAGAQGAIAAYFDLDAGAAHGTISTLVAGITGASAKVEPLNNGWYRCIVTCTVNGSTTNVTPYWGPTKAYATPDRSSTLSAGEGIYVWGIQVEIGAFATSYIPTTTATVTRAADSATMTGTNFSSWYAAATEGTFVVEFDGKDMTGSWAPSMAVFGNAVNTAIEIATNIGQGLAYVTDGGASQFNSGNLGAITADTLVKIALAFKANDFAACQGGGTVATDVSGSVPTVDTLYLAQDPFSRRQNGHISRLRFYNTRKSNADLQSLTT